MGKHHSAYETWTRLISGIGSCTVCMRKSFLMAMTSIGAAGLASTGSLFVPIPAIGIAGIWWLSLIASALFVLHVTTFGVRTGMRAADRAVKPGAADADRGDSPRLTRRNLVNLFARKAAVAMLAGGVTAIAPRSSYAYYICGNGNNGMTCSDESICCFNNRRGTFYCCWSDSRCGDDGYCY